MINKNLFTWKHVLKLVLNLKHFRFFLVWLHMRSYNRCTCIKGEDIPDEWILVSLIYNHVCYLDYRVLLWFREHTLSSGTFNVKAQYTKRSYFGPFTLKKRKSKTSNSRQQEKPAILTSKLLLCMHGSYYASLAGYH